MGSLSTLATATATGTTIATGSFINTTGNGTEEGTLGTTSGTSSSGTTDRTATVIYIAIGVVGTFSNLFSLTVLCSSRSMRRKMVNMLLINQSAIDMATSVVMAANGPSVSNTAISHTGAHGYFYCVFWASKLILWSLMLSSAYNLLCINIERYVSIVFPLFHKVSVRRKHICVAIAVTWLFGPLEKGLFTLPTSTYRDNNCVLASIWPSDTVKIVATVLNESLNFGVPVLITIFIYLHMAVVLRRTSKEATAPIHSPPNGAQQDQYQTRMSTAARNILKTMVTLTLCYLFCWSFNSVYFSLYIAGYTELRGSFYHFTVYTLFLNSVLNPFIYTAQYRAFRRQTLRLFLRRHVHDASLSASAERSDTNQV